MAERGEVVKTRNSSVLSHLLEFVGLLLEVVIVINALVKNKKELVEKIEIENQEFYTHFLKKILVQIKLFKVYYNNKKILSHF